MKQYLGLDIGGTEIKYGLIDERGELGEVAAKPTPMDSLTNFIETIGEIYDQYAEQIEGMAISMPGIIHSKTGYAVHGGSLLYISEMNMVEVLETRCPTTIHIENDGKAATLGELWKGALIGVQHGVMVVLGTGIAGGIVSNGQLLKGHNFSAGELSFVKTNTDRPDDRDYIFGYQNGLRRLFGKVSQKTAIPLAEINGHKVFELAEQGNAAVLSCLEEYCRTLAIQIFNLQTILDPERIVLSGGITGAPLLMEMVKKSVKQVYGEKDSVLFRRPEIVKSQHGNRANIIGALYNYKLNEDMFL